MNAVICSAIKARAVVQFSYDGGLRTVELYCHGTSTAGNEVVRGYQTGGYSSSGETMDWKLFDVSKVSGLRQTGTVFQANRPKYNPNDSAMRYVHCHV